MPVLALAYCYVDVISNLYPYKREAVARRACVAVTLWGSAFVAIRDAGETLAPGSLALGRLLVSLVVLGIAAAIWRAPLPERRDLLAIAAFGVLFLGVYSVTLNEAERRVDAGTAAMLINTGPILIAILAGVFLRRGVPAPAVRRLRGRLRRLPADRARQHAGGLRRRPRDRAADPRRLGLRHRRR